MKLCDELVNFETTREEILKLAQDKVDTTTDSEGSPIKKSRLSLTPSLPNKKKSIRNAKHSKFEATKARAALIFKASQRSPSPALVDETMPARSEDDDIIARQQGEIEELKRQLTRQSTCKLLLL